MKNIISVIIMLFMLFILSVAITSCSEDEFIFGDHDIPCKVTDLDGDGATGTTDLVILLSQWGECPPLSSITEFCRADFNLDGFVDAIDQEILLSNWGKCE